MKFLNPERTGFTRVGGTIVAAGYVACFAALGAEMMIYGSRPDASESTHSAAATPTVAPEIETPSEDVQSPSVSPSPSAIPSSASLKPSPRTTTERPVPASTSKSAKKRPAAPAADSVTLNPDACGDWSPKNPQPLIVNGNTARVVVDTRLEDSCEPGFYTGADVHEKPTAASKEVDLGTSFTTVGSTALNGSVLTVHGFEHGQVQSVQTPNGPVSSDIWLNIAFANGEVGNVSAVDVGFPTAAMLNKYVS